MNKDEELNRYMVQIEQYKEQMGQLEMQFQYLHAALADYNKAKMTLENLSNADAGSEVLVPIGGGAFIGATAKNTSKVLMDIGGDLVTEKTPEDVIKKIDERLENLEKTQEKMNEMMQNLQNEATEISAKAQKIISEQQG
ncbi:MAG: prefoldin subunit alpha [Thermoplasmatales archaeon]|nr:prefoldin subunit alpha [Thermoplasmatales archaeon]MCK4995689.1 prefoldin subunit alpha [Thermoplasmatales archaeon]MCK5636881.1 prefoldin subunit alpha [Thermoplasmatales archaeon]